MKKAAAGRINADREVRIASGASIPSIIRSLGGNPETLLGELGYDLRLFENPENRLSISARNKIVVHCAQRTHCPHFGLLIGQQNGLHTFGLVGLLVKYSADVGSALASLIRYTHIQVRSGEVNLLVDRNMAMLTWQLHGKGLVGLDHVGDATIATLHNVMRELCGPDWRPSEAWFAHRMPEDVGPYRRFFRIPLRFDAEHFALVFAAGYLRHRLPVSDPELRRLLQSQVDALAAQYPTDFAEQVRRVLGTSLATGQTTTEAVSALFGIHPRTLHRRLAECGVGLQQLVDECRFALARQLLQDTTMNVGQIADLLGYAAHGAFTRAFQRWSGVSPVEWREAQQRV